MEQDTNSGQHPTWCRLYYSAFSGQYDLALLELRVIMILKRICLIMALLCGSAAAQAASLNNVLPVDDGPFMSDQMGIVAASSAGVSYISGAAEAFDPPVGMPVSLGPVTISANFGVLPESFVASDSMFNVLLSGTTRDVADGTGSIRALFATTGGSLASDYGSLFMLTLSSPLFSETTLGDSNAVVVFDADVVVEAVAAVIPLPAGIWLLLAGLGGLVALKRRSI